MFLEIPIHDMRINAGDEQKIRSSEAHTSLETLVNERARCVADASSPGQAARPSATFGCCGDRPRMAAPFRYAPPDAASEREEPARHLPLIQGGQDRWAQSIVVSACVVVGAIVAGLLVVAWEAK